MAIHRVSTYPDISAKSVRVNIVLVKTGKKARRAKVTLQAACGADGKKLAPITFTVKMDKDTVAVDRTYAMGEDVRLWDEFSPVTYTLDVRRQAGKDTDTERTTFGMREVDSSKGYLAVNGNRVFLRGALESLHIPPDGQSAHRRGRLGKGVHLSQGLGAQPSALPLLLSARSRLRRCRPHGHVPAGGTAKLVADRRKG